MARCERCGEGYVEHPDLPDRGCWDGSARAEQVDRWVQLAPFGPPTPLPWLREIADPAAAPALRRHLDVSDPRVLAAVVCALGGSGTAEDGALLVPLLDHVNDDVREAAWSSLTELESPGAADLLALRLSQLPAGAGDPSDRQRRRVLDRLVWFRDLRARPGLLDLVERGALTRENSSRFSVPEALVRLGVPGDLELLSAAAVRVIRELLAGPDPRGQYEAQSVWTSCSLALDAVAPAVTDSIWEQLEDLPQSFLDRLHWHRHAAGLPTTDAFPHRSVPRRELVAVPPEAARPGPGQAKFLGQPDWREEPAWPVGGDGRLLMFLGQLPLDDSTTVYLFLGGPDEFTPLGPGSAAVVQPGGRCHLPTRAVARGPQAHAWFPVEQRYRRRSVRRPAQENFFELRPSADPASWEPQIPVTSPWHREPPGDWNKVGGTPRWLQGEESPDGAGWQYAFQFTAARVGSDRGDGAECYGWIRGDEAAFGWQCH